jgi:hypothetical protein
MNTPTTHANGSSGAFDPSQDEWKELARQSLQKPLPPKVDFIVYKAAVKRAIETGDKTAVAIVNRVLELQNDDQSKVSIHPAHNDSPNGQEAEGRQQSSPTKQERVEAPDSGIEMGENENVSNLLEASTGQSEPDKDSTPSSEQEEPGEAPTEPEKTPRESLKEQAEELEEKLKDEKDLLKLRKDVRMVETDKQKLKELDAEIARRKAEIKEIEPKLKDTKDRLLSIPPEASPDENQPWYGRVYANCRNFYVKMDDGTYKELSVEAASGFLKEWGISSRPDTQTTSPLDRAKNTIHNRHSVDWALALAGYQPGVRTLPGGKKVLITRGPSLLKPVEGTFPHITKFLDGMLGDQAVYYHGWMQLAVRPLYAGKIKKGQSIVFAGPIDSGKSALQNLIITPLLGGRVARPYAFLVGRTDFNEEWFESEHLMLEDETPPRDYETQQLVAAGLKSLSANDNQWCHGKGKKAVTLPPFWRVSGSVNDSPDALRVVPVNDPTLKDKMNVLKVYPEATVKLAKSLGGDDAFAAAVESELPCYLYWLLNVFEIPTDLRDTRYGMKAYQNPEIVEAVEETAPYVHLLEALREKVYSGGVTGLEKTLLEIAADIQTTPDVPKGIAPTSLITLGRYMTAITGITNEVVKKETNKGNRYVMTFPESEEHKRVHKK